MNNISEKIAKIQQKYKEDIKYLYESAMLPIGWGMDGYIELKPVELKGSLDAAIAFAAAIAADEWDETLAPREDPVVDEDI